MEMLSNHHVFKRAKLQIGKNNYSFKEGYYYKMLGVNRKRVGCE